MKISVDCDMLVPSPCGQLLTTQYALTASWLCTIPALAIRGHSVGMMEPLWGTERKAGRNKHKQADEPPFLVLQYVAPPTTPTPASPTPAACPRQSSHKFLSEISSFKPQKQSTFHPLSIPFCGSIRLLFWGARHQTQGLKHAG